MSMLRNVIGLMFGASMSYYMFTLAGGIPITLNMKNKDHQEYDEHDYIEIEGDCQ
tara:strand:- start:536 stop:700 length:165 start_codon:yes stop_codon:yes gene_type:complete